MFSCLRHQANVVSNAVGRHCGDIVYIPEQQMNISSAGTWFYSMFRNDDFIKAAAAFFNLERISPKFSMECLNNVNSDHDLAGANSQCKFPGLMPGPQLRDLMSVLTAEQWISWQFKLVYPSLS
jgi:hypothetical protein